MKKAFIVIVLLFLNSLFVGVHAQINRVPASTQPIEYHQPDSTILTITLKGDENLHWAVTSDGYTLLSNNENGYEYAKLDKNKNLVRSGRLAHNESNRTRSEIRFLRKITKGLSFSEAQIIKSKE